MKMYVKRGDIFFSVDLSGARGSEQGGIRPCIIVSNDICNKYSTVVTVVPITAQTTKANIPTHLDLDMVRYKFKRPSIALAEQVTSVDKERLKDKHYKRISDDDMEKLDELLKIQLGLIKHTKECK